MHSAAEDCPRHWKAFSLIEMFGNQCALVRYDGSLWMKVYLAYTPDNKNYFRTIDNPLTYKFYHSGFCEGSEQSHTHDLGSFRDELEGGLRIA